MNYCFCTVDLTRSAFKPVISKFIEYISDKPTLTAFLSKTTHLMSAIRMIFNLLLTVALLTGVTEKATAQTQTERIAIYSKVWGFLKYHHPNVAGGTINWDSVFIAHIDQVIAATDCAQLNVELSTLIAAAGPVDNPWTVRLSGDIFVKNHDLRWLQDSSVLNKQNRKTLQFIYTHRNRGNNRFVKFNNYTDYGGENPYEEMTWPKAEYRLLFVARFWNAIDYYDPYKCIAAVDWNTVLSEFIPKVRNVTDTLEYHKILLQLAVILHDGHAQLITKDEIWGKYTLPVYISILNDTVLINRMGDDSLCRAAKIQKGDIILAIDGEPISKRMERFKLYTTFSNQVSLNRHLEFTLLCTEDTVQQVTLRRGLKVFRTRVGTMLKSSRNWQYINDYTANQVGYKTIGNSIAQVYTMQIWDKNVDSIKALISSKKAVIFDARNYTQNDAFYNIFGMFLSTPSPISYETEIMPDDPGFFNWKLSPKLGYDNAKPYTGTVIILADERCQSQGEYSVMTLQTIPHSVTIGSQTAGTDGVVSYIPMGGQLGITYSGYGIYYPDKTPTQQRGVRIDILAKRTLKSIAYGQDPALEVALKYLRAKGIN
jgi:carboxyl-terminal processing protease